MCIGLGLLFKHRSLEKQRMLCDAAPSPVDTLKTISASWTGFWDRVLILLHMFRITCCYLLRCCTQT